MSKVKLLSKSSALLTAPTRSIFELHQRCLCQHTDHLFAGLMLFQWVMAIIVAIWISPRTWEGIISNIHIHVLAAIFLGGAITLFPVCLAILRPGKMMTRHVIAASQMLMSGLLIHLTGGRIETHFHIFGSLALLAFYRDWKVLLTASFVTALDHAVRGVIWPQSIYGTAIIEPWRWLEHTGWVVFEDIFLMKMIEQDQKLAWDSACRQAELQKMNEAVEAKVEERTLELQNEINERKEAECELENTNFSLKLLSKELERSRDQAVQTSRFKSEFLATMSHEIRTPLNAIIGMSDLLTRTTKLSDEQHELGVIINDSADLLLNIVNDILDYSKIEAGRLDLEINEFDIVELVEGTAELVSQRVRDKKLSLVTFIDPKLPRILRADAGRIRQILLNFLSNSVKFTSAGEIVMRAVLVSPITDRVAEIRFSVSDTGIGLTDIERAKIFQPFVQADASITRKFGGTGLGLAICKRLIELIGGNIEMESVYKEGSVFGFKAKFEIALDQTNEKIRAPMDDLHDSRVLIIEGPTETHRVLNVYISSWGMRCSNAIDINAGALMLQHAADSNDPFDLILVVFEPSQLQPLKMLEDLGNQFNSVKERLIVAAGCADRGFGAKVLKNGFAAYLSLPIRQSKLFDCAINLLGHNPAYIKPTVEQVVDTREVLPVPAPGKLILVVEDNPVNQKVALLQLEELGLAAHAVSNGFEALDALQRTQYNLILMDCQMPEMDGYQATKEIRKREVATGKHSTIIAMTANALSSDRINCLAAGMDDYISKPINQKRLSEVLQRWLPINDFPGDVPESSAESGQTMSNAKASDIEAFLAKLLRKGGPDLLRDFLSNMDGLLKKVKEAIAEKDIVSLRPALHQLKGTPVSFYATEMGKLSNTFEKAAQNEVCDWEMFEQYLEELQKAWQGVKGIVEKSLIDMKLG